MARKGPVQITMSRKQAELLTSLLSDLAGQVLYRARKLANTRTGDNFDHTHEVWQEIALAVAKPIERENEILSAQEPKNSIHIRRLLQIVRREA